MWPTEEDAPPGGFHRGRKRPAENDFTSIAKKAQDMINALRTPQAIVTNTDPGRSKEQRTIRVGPRESRAGASRQRDLSSKCRARN